MVENHGLVGSFDLANMDVQELQRAAFLPYRFENALLHKKMTNKPALKLSPEGTSYSFHAAKLIPGGRWLVTLAERQAWGSHWLMIWDLQYPVKANFKRTARYNFPIGFIPSRIHLQPAKTHNLGSGTVIIVESENQK